MPAPLPGRRPVQYSLPPIARRPELGTRNSVILYVSGVPLPIDMRPGAPQAKEFSSMKKLLGLLGLAGAIGAVAMWLRGKRDDDEFLDEELE